MIPDFGLSMQVQKQMDAAYRLRAEARFVCTMGKVNGEPFEIVIAVGPAAAKLRAFLAEHCEDDPRSTTAGD